MSICVDVESSGYLVQSLASVDDCTAFVLTSATEYGFMAANMVLTPADVLYLYAWGMGAILIPWSVAYGINAAKAVIKKL